MAKRISDLPVSGATTAGDQYEVDQAGTSKRQAASQVATFMETNLSKLVLSGGLTSINADGSASFASGLTLISIAGDLQLGGGAASISGVDGSASFANGALTIAVNGTATSDTGFVAGANGTQGTVQVNDAAGATQIQLNGNGSAQFKGGVNGIITVDAGLVVGANGTAGNITIQDAGLNPQMVFDATTGVASFALGAFVIASDGTPSINTLPGITRDVLVAGVGTLHFELGILTSIV